MKERIRELNEQLNSRITITGTKYLLVDRTERVGAQHTVQLVWSILEREDEEPQQQNSSNASLRTTASSSSVNSPRQDRHGDVMNGSLVNNAYSPVHYELLNRLGDGAPPSSSTFITATASTSPLVNHTPYRRNDRERNTSHASNHSAYGQPIFRTCPFYSGLYLLASMVFTEVSNVKMTETIRFSLKSKDIEKLTGTSYVSKRKTPIISGHRVMIYCVDASQWIATPNAPLPVEFPPVLELSINGTLIRKNLRGIKSRPGTVHPVDITSLCCLKPGATNQLDIVYINSPKRYAFTIWLSQAKEATELVDLLKQRDPFEKIDAQKLLKQITDDSEVMTTCSDVSLRCPLTHIRIRLPCRSRLCKHIQCFDGISFIELNAQTPTWQCPICNRIMTSWEELIWDAYFKQILDSTSTNDQAEWSIKPNTTQSASVPSTPKSPRSPPKSGEKRKRLLLDIDDDDDNEDTSRDSLSEKKSNIASSTATTSSPSNNGINSKPIPQVIDLTLSSSEDEDDDGDGDDDDASSTNGTTTTSNSDNTIISNSNNVNNIIQ
ncbi:PINIT domain-containing protein [Syncephalis plumigaleata]|nr:PINIT domain-containing protein [Syncephalis plumigaleata]